MAALLARSWEVTYPIERRNAAGTWVGSPLLAAYSSVYFERLWLGGIERSHAKRQPAVAWAIGCGPDGQVELLGAWSHPMATNSCATGIFVDLLDRGVESIRCVSSVEPNEVAIAARATFPDALVLPSAGALVTHTLAMTPAKARVALARSLADLWQATSVDAAEAALAAVRSGALGRACPDAVHLCSEGLPRLEAVYTLSSRLRRLVLSVDETAHRIRQSLQRAVDHKRYFEDGASVIAFISVELDRIDRRRGGPGTVAGRRGGVRDAGCSRAMAWGH